jgi:hypothetical protein
MTPKEKAEELVLKYLKVKTHQMFNGWWHKMTAKECALIAVDEIIKSQKCCYECKYEGSIELKYWSDVKHEIEKL